jgi:hypothetical protein
MVGNVYCSSVLLPFHLGSLAARLQSAWWCADPSIGGPWAHGATLLRPQRQSCFLSPVDHQELCLAGWELDVGGFGMLGSILSEYIRSEPWNSSGIRKVVEIGTQKRHYMCRPIYYPRLRGQIKGGRLQNASVCVSLLADRACLNPSGWYAPIPPGGNIIPKRSQLVSICLNILIQSSSQIRPNPIQWCS